MSETMSETKSDATTFTRFTRNENYQGDDPAIARPQAQADAWFADIAREWRGGGSTLTADDRLEIIALGNLWDGAYDALDFESWMSVWASETECTFASNAFGERRGLDDMRDYYMNYKKTFSGLRHVLSNHLIVGHGDTARQYCYLCVFERITGTSMLGSAVFFDALRKVDGRWKFVRRDQVADPGMTLNPAAQALLAKFTQGFGV